MSYITEAVVWVHSERRDLAEALTAPLPFDEQRQQVLRPLETDDAGGTKWFTSGLYAAAFNYVSGDDLEGWFKSLPWRPYDRATLIWETESAYEGRVEIGAFEPDGWG